MKYFTSTLSSLLTILFVSIGLLATAQQKGEKDYIKTTEKGTQYQLIGWETKVVYNPYTFTWFAWEEPIIEASTAQMTSMVPVSEFDRPPVFDGYCLTKKDQFACSNQKLQEYIAERSVDYPDAAQLFEQEGLEYVTFTLDRNGKFEGNLKVVSKEDPCAGCAETAVDIVASMEDKWFPAIKDGKTVKTQLTVPIRFKIVD